MNPLRRFGRWLCARVFRTAPVVPAITPELLELKERADALEAHAEAVDERADLQDQRLSQVEVRIGIRSPVRWPTKRDAS